MAAEHEQAALRVGEDLAEIDRRAHEAPLSNVSYGPPCTSGPLIWRGPGSIEARPVGDRDVAQRLRRRGHRLRNVQRELEPVPGRLGVGELDAQVISAVAAVSSRTSSPPASTP